MKKYLIELNFTQLADLRRLVAKQIQYYDNSQIIRLEGSTICKNMREYFKDIHNKLLIPIIEDRESVSHWGMIKTS